MNGTWKQTGGGDDPARIVVAVVAVVAAILAIEWVAARIWWILGGTAVLAVAAILAVRWLVRWQQRREAVWGERRPAMRYARADEVASAERRAVAPVHLHFHGLTVAEAAEVARRQIEQ